MEKMSPFFFHGGISLPFMNVIKSPAMTRSPPSITETIAFKARRRINEPSNQAGMSQCQVSTSFVSFSVNIGTALAHHAQIRPRFSRNWSNRCLLAGLERLRGEECGRSVMTNETKPKLMNSGATKESRWED